MATVITQAIGKAQSSQQLPSSIARQILSSPQRSTHQCDACGDTGWRPATEAEKIAMDYNPGYSVSVPCEYCAGLRIARQTAELQAMSMLTEQEKCFRLGSIKTKNRTDTAGMVRQCREMLEGQSSMLTIWGTNGNAKSVALIATVNEFLERGIPAMYVPSYDLLNWLQDAFSSNGEVKSESMFARLERVKYIRALAVDEFQAIKITDWRLEQLRNIVDRRWRDGLDGRSFTLFAMNEDPASLEPRI